jgi:hypothetical protein
MAPWISVLGRVPKKPYRGFSRIARIYADRLRRDGGIAKADWGVSLFLFSPFAVSAFIRKIRVNPR